MNIVIIGGGASGLTTASNIREFDEDSQIIVFTTQKHVAYSPCAIPYVIGGHIDSFNDIIMHRPEEYMRKNIRILTETTVTEIDKDLSEVVYEDKNGLFLTPIIDLNQTATVNSGEGNYGSKWWDAIYTADIKFTANATGVERYNEILFWKRESPSSAGSLTRVRVIQAAH